MVFRRLEGNENAIAAAHALPELWSVSKVAAYLKVSPAKVRRLIRLRKIQATKVGGHWRVPTDAIVGFLEENISIMK